MLLVNEKDYQELFLRLEGGHGGLSVFTCTRDVEAFLKKTAIAYHPNPRKGAEFGGMQWKPFLKTLRRREYSIRNFSNSPNKPIID